MVIVPVLARPAVVEIPERLAMMVRQEPKKPAPLKKAKPEKKEEKKLADKAQEKPKQERPKIASAVPAPAPKKVENTGVLKFKDAFKDLIEETPNARLGNEARLSNPLPNRPGRRRRAVLSLRYRRVEDPAGGSAMPRSAVISVAAAGATVPDLAVQAPATAQASRE